MFDQRHVRQKRRDKSRKKAENRKKGFRRRLLGSHLEAYPLQNKKANEVFVKVITRWLFITSRGLLILGRGHRGVRGRDFSGVE